MAIRKDTIQLSLEINGVKAGTTYKELRKNARDLKRELDGLTPGTDAFIKKTQELKKVNNVLATIRNETRGVAHGFNSLTDVFKKGLAASLAFFSVQRVLQWGREVVAWAIKGTSALEAMQRKSAIVFGDAIDLVEDFAAINAQALGVTEEAYIGLAATIGDILIPMGFQREEAAKMSTDLVNLSGALSEWSNGQRTAEEVSRILAKALTGERESLKELGIVITEADVSARLLANGQEKLTGTALQQAKAQANLQLIMERSVDAQRAFATNQDAVARSGSRILAFWNQTREALLERVLPAWRAVGKAIADIVSPIKRQSDATRALQAQFNVQIETLKRGDLSYENRIKLINQINTKYKDYLPNLLTEESSLTDIAAAQKAANEQFEKRIVLLASEEALVDVNTRQIKAKQAELDLQQQLTAATIALNDELTKAGVEVDLTGEYVKNEQFAAAFEKSSVQRAAREAQRIQDRVDANQAEQEALRKQYDLTRDAAVKLGLDIDSILGTPGDGPGGDTPTDTPDQKARLKAIEERINLERQLRIRAIEHLRDDEEIYAAARERINIESDIKIARQQADLYKKGSLEQAELLQEALDKEAELRANAIELTFEQEKGIIERERELRIADLQTQINDEQELARKIEIVRLQSEQRIAQAKLATLKASSPEYIQAANEIAAREKEIAQKTLEDTIATAESGLAIRRDMAILALDELELEEEDYNKARERIALETDIAILSSRLALYKENAEERLAIEREIRDKTAQLDGITFSVDAGTASSGGFSTQAGRDTDLDERAEKLRVLRDTTLDITTNLATSQLQIERDRISQTLQAELDAINATAEAKRQAAGDDALALKKIDAEARLAREEAEKKAARERKKLARKEAVIQGALAVVEALPNVAAAIAAGVATAAQIAVIDGQSFYKGGHTGRKGVYKDISGHDVAGVVHTHEWVAPRHMVEDPVTGPMISYLERVRQSKGGRAEGGYGNPNTTPSAYVQTITSTGSADEMSRMITLLESIRDITAAWPTLIEAYVSLNDLESKQSELAYIKGKATA